MILLLLCAIVLTTTATSIWLLDFAAELSVAILRASPRALELLMRMRMRITITNNTNDNNNDNSNDNNNNNNSNNNRVGSGTDLHGVLRVSEQSVGHSRALRVAAQQSTPRRGIPRRGIALRGAAQCNMPCHPVRLRDVSCVTKCRTVSVDINTESGPGSREL